jgi:N-acetyl-anhydromuramyl-L-alanine amidase AmpD
MVTTISPHCMINNECLHLQLKKYQIETWHIGVTKHNTCNYYMNIATINP